MSEEYKNIVGCIFFKEDKYYFVEDTFFFEGCVQTRLRKLGSWDEYRIPAQYLVHSYTGWAKHE